MFQFTAFALCLTHSDGSTSRRVAPFGHLWISPCQRVPTAFRRLPRPSSPSEALGIPQTPFCCVFPRVDVYCIGQSIRTCPPYVLRHKGPDPKSLLLLDSSAGQRTACLTRIAPNQTLSLTDSSTRYTLRAGLTSRRKANQSAPKRRCSSRTFRYGYLVTT